jgi:D-sedoheptulose 7-phosphate isomerase
VTIAFAGDYLSYVGHLHAALGGVLSKEGGFAAATQLAYETGKAGKRICFLGNGGSAAIASHMAADWLKNGRFVAQCFNDGAALTCIANDLGFECVFSTQLQAHGRAGDLLVAISSSGKSLDILNAVVTATSLGMNVITLSGFAADNPLRGMGTVNFYVPSSRYGIVETAHLAILHAILDKVMETKE